MKKWTLLFLFAMFSMASYCQMNQGMNQRWSGWAVSVERGPDGVLHVGCEDAKHVCVSAMQVSPGKNRATIYEKTGKETTIEYSTSEEKPSTNGGTDIYFKDAVVVK